MTMAEIKNYTMNFSAGRPSGLTCPKGTGKLACTEIHCVAAGTSGPRATE